MEAPKYCHPLIPSLWSSVLCTEYSIKLCQYSHSKGSGLDLFFQTVLWAQDAFCLATSVIWTKIFHKETTSKMFPFFCSKLHGNSIHLNLLVASNRNQLELAGTNPKSFWTFTQYGVEFRGSSCADQVIISSVWKCTLGS